MKYVIIILIFFCFVSCSENPVQVEINTPIDTSNVYVPQNSITVDCGMSPYLLLGDQMFADSTQWYKVSVRFVKIVREKEPEDIDIRKINAAIDRLNKDYQKARLTFEAEEITVIENPKAFREGIDFYRTHASLYNKDGFLNIYIYPSTIGGYSGAAGSIPSTYFCIKEYYLPTSTVSHEIFHCFGGYHTHQQNGENRKNSYETGDLVCETPAADFYALNNGQGYLGRVNDDCEYVGPLGNLTSDEHKRNILNIGSYSLSSCRRMFEKEQISRMHWIINNSENHKAMMTLTKTPKYVL